MKSLFAPIAVATLLAIAVPALADDDHNANRLNVPSDQWLSPDQIADKLAAKGYKVRKIEAEDGAYEVEMTYKDGMLVEAHVHPATGDLLPNYGD